MSANTTSGSKLAELNTVDIAAIGPPQMFAGSTRVAGEEHTADPATAASNSLRNLSAADGSLRKAEFAKKLRREVCGMGRSVQIRYGLWAEVEIFLASE